jgi:hypothetical protein
MGVVIEICAKHPGGPTRITVTDVCMVCIIVRVQVLAGTDTAQYR